MTELADHHAAELVERACGVAQQAIGEVRWIAHGSLPGGPDRRGAALAGLASRAPIDVKLLESPQVRADEGAQAAAYFAAAEAVRAAARTDTRARVDLSARIVGAKLGLSVQRLGDAADDPDLLGLENRVDALGGKVLSEPGARLAVQIPLEGVA